MVCRTLHKCSLQAHLIASRGHAAPTSHMDDGIAAYWKQISGHGLGATEAAIVAAQVAGGTGAHPKSCTPQLLHKQALTLTSVPAAELPVDVNSVIGALSHTERTRLSSRSSAKCSPLLSP